MTKEKILASDEAWETGQLGEDFGHAQPLKDDIESQIDEALELQMISIRLQKSLLEDLKGIAALRRIGYQPLIRQVLNRFVECEKKQILRERVSEMEERVRKETKASEPHQPEPARHKKVA